MHWSFAGSRSCFFILSFRLSVSSSLFATGMVVDSPQRPSGMEACGGGATGGSHRKHISRHHLGVRTMNGQPVQACGKAAQKI